mmetsp:Transcript_53900/g.161274  ORF Transcript_53900/g.161274 Transcript_53900/m.161274 type:complete len:834 (-) Transcript_53900:220-2721(-)
MGFLRRKKKSSSSSRSSVSEGSETITTVSSKQTSAVAPNPTAIVVNAKPTAVQTSSLQSQPSARFSTSILSAVSTISPTNAGTTDGAEGGSEGERNGAEASRDPPPPPSDAAPMESAVVTKSSSADHECAARTEMKEESGRTAANADEKYEENKEHSASIGASGESSAKQTSPTKESTEVMISSGGRNDASETGNRQSEGRDAEPTSSVPTESAGVAVKSAENKTSGASSARELPSLPPWSKPKLLSAVANDMDDDSILASPKTLNRQKRGATLGGALSFEVVGNNEGSRANADESDSEHETDDKTKSKNKLIKKMMKKTTEKMMMGESIASHTKTAQRRREKEKQSASGKKKNGDDGKKSGGRRGKKSSLHSISAPTEIKVLQNTRGRSPLKGIGVDDSSKRKKGRADKRANEGLLRSKHKKACNDLRDGDLDEALREFEEVLSILVSSYGHSHRRVGAALHNIGIVQVRAGRYDEALDAIEEAVRIRRGALGPNHPKVADSLVELGIALLSMEEYEDSLDIFHEALEMREMEAEIAAEESDDDDDSSNEEDSEARKKRRAEEEEKAQLTVSKVLNNIGCVHFESGDSDEALETYEEALEIQRDIVEERGADKDDDITVTRHPAALNLASTLCNIGYVRMELGHWKEAMKLFEEASGIQEVALERGNKLCVNTMDNLGYSKLMYKNYIGAIKTFTIILGILDSCDQSDTLEAAETRWKMVHAHLNLCEYSKALEHLRVIEDIQEQELGDDSHEFRATRELVGWLKYETLKYPSPIEVLSRMVTSRKMSNPCTERLCCACSSGNINEVDLASLCDVQMPENSCKMSGHKVSYA